MLHAIRRLLTVGLHPLERAAAVSLRGGPEDAEALIAELDYSGSITTAVP